PPQPPPPTRGTNPAAARLRLPLLERLRPSTFQFGQKEIVIFLWIEIERRPGKRIIVVAKRSVSIGGDSVIHHTCRISQQYPSLSKRRFIRVHHLRLHR